LAAFISCGREERHQGERKSRLVTHGRGKNLGDGSESHGVGSLGQSVHINISLLGGGDVSGRRVALLENASTAGEDNKSGLVALEAINVRVQRLLALVGPSVVNRNADGLCELSVDASSL
jgi:hypothetical protein